MPDLRENPVLARAAPFVLFIVFLVAESFLPGAAAAAHDMPSASWLPVVRGAAVALLLLWFWRVYTELGFPERVKPAQWLIAVLAGLGVFLLWVSVDADWAVTARSEGFAPVLADGSVDWVKALLRLAGFALVVPVMEELFWRSLVMRWIARHDFLALPPRQVGARAFLVTTALFAIEHERWFAGAVAGAAYGALYMLSGNLWVPIVAHAVTNGALGLWILTSRNWEFW